MTTSSEQAVTVLISRKVKQGCETDFVRVMEQIIAVAATFKGHLGAQLVHPGDEQGAYDSLYHVVLAFDNDANLKIWQNSPARSLGLAAAAPYIEGQELVRQFSGLAHWFQAPTGPKQLPPPRWKVAVVTWLGIFPTVYSLFFLLSEPLSSWPLVLRIMLLTVLVVMMMTWVVAPQLTNWFKPWLYSVTKT
jgi:uncharacterized protein